MNNIQKTIKTPTFKDEFDRDGGMKYSSQQKLSAHIIFGMLMENIKTKIWLCAEAQCGKTGAIMYLINKLLYNKPPYFIIFVTSISDNSLRTQNGLRMTDGYGINTVDVNELDIIKYDTKNVLNLHNGNLSDNNLNIIIGYIKRNNIKNVLVISDEGHFAQKNGSRSDMLCLKIKKAKVMLTELDITATGFAHTIAFYNQTIDNKLPNVGIVKLGNGNGYFGLEALKNSNRLKPSLIYSIGKKVIGKNVDCLMNDFLNQCQKDGNGYCIWRITKSTYPIIVKYIKRYYPNIKMVIYSSNSSDGILKNSFGIKAINLDNPSDKPTIIFIKNALKAGVTINTKYIRQWIDGVSLSTKDDNSLQSAARSFGYGRNKDRYNIYSNLDIDTLIRHYQCIEKNIPMDVTNSGVGNSKSKNIVTTSNRLLLLNSKTRKDLNIEASELLGIINLEFNGVNNSHIESNNWFEDVYKGNLRMRTHDKESNKVRVLCINGANKTADKTFYNMSMKQMPKLKNRNVLIVSETEYIKISKTKFRNLASYVRPPNNGVGVDISLIKTDSRLLKHLK